MKPRVGIVTTFYNFDPAYSLCAVVRDQLIALAKNGYRPILFVLKSFKDEALVPEGVEIRKVVPHLLLEPYKELHVPDHIQDDVAKARAVFEEHLADVDVLIAHDIFFIDTFLPYNIAIRKASEKFPSLRILAWTHSAPSARPLLEDNHHADRFNLPPQTTLVYLNHDKAQDLAEMYGAWLKDVRVVYNSRDPRTFWNLDPFVVSLIDRYQLLEADIISVYPLSTPRMIIGKGLDKAIKLHAKLKTLGYKTRLIVPNAHANASPEQRLIAETRLWAQDQGVENHELIFTSQEDKRFELGVPSNIVSDLFRLSNIFIFPTVSENSSLVLLEAMLSGNLLVLNRRVGTLLEHVGNDALYFDFDYREPRETNEAYYLDLAKIIASQFQVSKPLQAKRHAMQRYNYDRVFQDIERLIYEVTYQESKL